MCCNSEKQMFERKKIVKPQQDMAQIPENNNMVQPYAYNDPSVYVKTEYDLGKGKT